MAMASLRPVKNAAPQHQKGAALQQGPDSVKFRGPRPDGHPVVSLSNHAYRREVSFDRLRTNGLLLFPGH